MKQRLQCYLLWTVLSLPFICLGTGCNVIGEAASTPLPPQAYLMALRIEVDRVREGTPVPVSEEDRVDIKKDDRVQVKDKGRGLLSFADRLQVEVFRDTELQLENAYLEPDGFFLGRLRQNAGHAQYKLNEERDNRIEVKTAYAVITALGTDFLVCHGAELTCMVTLSGEVEVEGKDEIVTIRTGEAAYVLPGQAPIGPICANIAEVRQWLDQKRSATDKEPLGALVKRWPQQTCSEASSPPSPTSELVVVPTSTATLIPEPTATTASSTTFPTPEPAATTSAPPAPQPLCTVVTQVLNLRFGPGFRYNPPVATLFTGMLLDPLARSPDAHWFQVRVRETGQTGWVSAKPAYLSCNVLTVNLPISQ